MAEFLIITPTTSIKDVTPEVRTELEKLVIEVVSEYDEGEQIDWERVWDKLDAAELTDGRVLDIVTEDSPLQRLLKRFVYGR